jgi:hypothetical protein
LRPWVAELARLNAEEGHRAEAEELLQQLAEARPQSAMAAPIAFADIALGSIDAAFEGLTRAADVRAPALLWIDVDPRFDRVRDDPRCRALRARVGVPDSR